MKKCRVISKVGIGVDNINVKAATENGIIGLQCSEIIASMKYQTIQWH